MIFDKAKVEEKITPIINECNANPTNLRNYTPKLLSAALDVCRKGQVFENRNESLNNLAYNAFVVFLTQYIDEKPVTSNDMFMSIIESAIKDTKSILSGIEGCSEILETPEKLNAYYSIMNNNHLFIMNIPTVIEYISNDIKDALNMHTPKLSLNSVSNSNAIQTLFMKSNSHGYSRFQRAVEIITENCGQFTKYNDNGEKVSNLDNLNLSKEDIQTLHLFTSIRAMDLSIISEILQKSIIIEDEKRQNYSIYRRVLQHFFFFIPENGFVSYLNIFTPVDANYCENSFKRGLSLLQDCDDKNNLYFNISNSDINTLMSIEGFDIDNFIDIVGNNYTRMFNVHINSLFSTHIDIMKNYHAHDKVVPEFNYKVERITSNPLRLPIEKEQKPKQSKDSSKLKFWLSILSISGILLILLIIAITIYIHYHSRLSTNTYKLYKSSSTNNSKFKYKELTDSIRKHNNIYRRN
ncbi:hypothetical protein NEIG_01306 [Nematocida sp. ERTm5]|nr:hypothetical protein NEIG_01306 [Nematocida sp. ERTm5]